MTSDEFFRSRYSYELYEACLENNVDRMVSYLNKKLNTLVRCRHPYINSNFIHDIRLCRKHGYFVNKHYEEFLIRRISTV